MQRQDSIETFISQWKKERPIGTAHATPLLVEHDGQKDLLVAGQNRLTAFDAKTRAELWRFGEGEGPYNGEIISSPVYCDGMVFLQLWRQSLIHAIRLTWQPKENIIPLTCGGRPGRRALGSPPRRLWTGQAQALRASRTECRCEK